MSSILTLCLALAATTTLDDRPALIVVVGAPGTPEYGSAFRQWAEGWQAAGAKGSTVVIPIGLDENQTTNDHDRLRQAIADQPRSGREPLWIVLIGHGSHDGRESKFNLRGPDVTDTELLEWLKPLQRPLAILDCTSSSGAFLNKLSGDGRVVVTATRTGSEQNYARFGQYLAEAIADPATDLDKDGQVSLLEAFVTASKRTEEFYKSKGRLATEHALIDDNGDKMGTPADWFQGVRAIKRAKTGASPDGLRAHQITLIPSDRERSMPPEIREKRNQIEITLSTLRDQKAKLPEAEYYAKVEPLMLELARLYRDLP